MPLQEELESQGQLAVSIPEFSTAGDIANWVGTVYL